MTTLYSLTAEYLEVLEMAENSEVDPQVIVDTLESLAGDIEVKADGYAKVMKELETQANAIKEEEQRLAARRKVLENNATYMKKSLENCMLATDTKKIKTTLFSFNIQKNPPSLVIDKPDAIPEEFLVPQPPKVDNAKIKELLKEQQLDYAHLEQGESLRIK